MQAFSSDLEEDTKGAIWDSFQKGQTCILCVTDAAGMGCNVPDIKYVVSFGLPKATSSFHGILQLNLTLLLLPPSSLTGGKGLLHHPTECQHLNNKRQKRLTLLQSILNQHLDHFKFPGLSLQLSLVLCHCHIHSHGWLCMDPIKAVSLSLLLALNLCHCYSHNHS